MNIVDVDFSKCTEEIRPLNGVCCAPYSVSMGKKQKVINEMFKSAHIPYCRLHDCCGSWGGSHIGEFSGFSIQFKTT